MKELHEITSVNTNVIKGIANDAFSGFVGFGIGNLYAITWVYQAREYVRDRLRFEKTIDFSRKR